MQKWQRRDCGKNLCAGFLRHSNDVTKLNVKCFILNRCDRRTSRHWSLLSYEYIVVENIDLSLRQPKDGGKIIITKQAYFIFERGDEGK